MNKIKSFIASQQDRMLQSQQTETLRAITSNDRGFTQLDIGKEQDDGFIDQACEALQHNRFVTKLKLHHRSNGVTEAIPSLARLCKRSLTLVAVKISFVGLTDENLSALVGGLMDNSSVISLALDNNLLAKADALTLLIEHNKVLEHIDLTNNHLGKDGDDEFKKLADALPKNSHRNLKCLQLGGNGMTDNAAKYFCVVIEKSINSSSATNNSSGGAGDASTNSETPPSSTSSTLPIALTQLDFGPELTVRTETRVYLKNLLEAKAAAIIHQQTLQILNQNQTQHIGALATPPQSTASSVAEHTHHNTSGNNNYQGQQQHSSAADISPRGGGAFVVPAAAAIVVQKCDAETMTDPVRVMPFFPPSSSSSSSALVPSPPAVVETGGDSHSVGGAGSFGGEPAASSSETTEASATMSSQGGETTAAGGTTSTNVCAAEAEKEQVAPPEEKDEENEKKKEEDEKKTAEEEEAIVVNSSSSSSSSGKDIATLTQLIQTLRESARQSQEAHERELTKAKSQYDEVKKLLSQRDASIASINTQAKARDKENESAMAAAYQDIKNLQAQVSSLQKDAEKLKETHSTELKSSGNKLALDIENYQLEIKNLKQRNESLKAEAEQGASHLETAQKAINAQMQLENESNGLRTTIQELKSKQISEMQKISEHTKELRTQLDEASLKISQLVHDKDKKTGEIVEGEKRLQNALFKSMQFQRALETLTLSQCGGVFALTDGDQGNKEQHADPNNNTAMTSGSGGGGGNAPLIEKSIMTDPMPLPPPQIIYRKKPKAAKNAIIAGTTKVLSVEGGGGGRGNSSKPPLSSTGSTTAGRQNSTSLAPRSSHNAAPSNARDKEPSEEDGFENISFGDGEDTHQNLESTYGQMTKEKWAKDEEVDTCMAKCGTKFSLTRRKHHCRRCGNIYCDKCAPKSKMHGMRLCILCLRAGSGAEVGGGTSLNGSIGDM